MSDIIPSKSLHDQDWLNIRRKLVAYAMVKVDLYNLNRELTAEDLVQEAIIKLFEGIRIWNKQNCPDLLYFLKRVIDSDINSYINTNKMQLEAVFENEEGINIIDDIDSQIVNPAEEFISNEKLEEIKANLKNDDDAALLFIYLLEGYSYKELCKEMNIDDQKRNNIVKRIKRKLKIE